MPDIWAFQLDLCKKMATSFTGTSVGHDMWFSMFVCLGGCNFSSYGASYMGMLVDHNLGSRYNWIGCNNGWHCSSIGILFYHALVENKMAKLKCVISHSFNHVIIYYYYSSMKYNCYFCNIYYCCYY